MKGNNKLCTITIISVLFSILVIVFWISIHKTLYPQTNSITSSGPLETDMHNDEENDKKEHENTIENTGEIIISEYEIAQEDDVQMEFNVDNSMAMDIAIDKANNTNLYSSPEDFKMHAIGMSFINGNLYYGFAQYPLSEEARIATLYIDATTGKAYFFHLNHSGYNTLIEME